MLKTDNLTWGSPWVGSAGTATNTSFVIGYASRFEHPPDVALGRILFIAGILEYQYDSSRFGVWPQYNMSMLTQNQTVDCFFLRLTEIQDGPSFVQELRVMYIAIDRKKSPEVIAVGRVNAVVNLNGNLILMKKIHFHTSFFHSTIVKQTGPALLQLQLGLWAI